jgi:hypothetical protein
MLEFHWISIRVNPIFAASAESPVQRPRGEEQIPMTALRNFPDAPLARQPGKPIEWKAPHFVIKVWNVLHRYGQLRAARELDVLADRRALGDPVLARQLRAAGAQCRQSAKTTATQG